MLTGRINNLQARVTVEILDSNGQSNPIEVLLDTGFDGQLSLPVFVVRQFNLGCGILRFGELADGTQVQFMSYRATVLWDGQRRQVEVIESGNDPLLGMELMLGSRVVLDVREGGPVTIGTLP